MFIISSIFSLKGMLNLMGIKCVNMYYKYVLLINKTPPAVSEKVYFQHTCKMYVLYRHYNHD
jgi:hypothetical protein